MNHCTYWEEKGAKWEEKGAARILHSHLLYDYDCFDYLIKLTSPLFNRIGLLLTINY